MSISPAAFPSGPRSPTPDLVVPGIQFSWGGLLPLVSAWGPPLAPGGMNGDFAFSVAVLPLAVPPQMMADSPCSTLSHKYATISGDAVPYLMSSTGGRGFSLNRLMVNDAPLVVTSLAYVACTLCPSGVVPSNIGFETDSCLPHLWPRLITNELRSSSLSNDTLVLIDSNLLWKTNSG